MSSVTRGTTPTLRFKVPFDTSIVKVGYITFSQDKEIILEKNNTDWEVDEDSYVIHLTQEDTLKLIGNDSVKIQMRVKTFDGEALASNIVKVSTREVLKDGAI